MFKIDLNFNNAYQWYNEQETHVIGYIFYKNTLYQKQELAMLIHKMSNEEILKLIKTNLGFFSIVKKTSKEILIISDIIRSFPVFYEISNNKILITDNVKSFSKLNIKSIKEIKLLRYVSGELTLYNGVYQIESSQILKIRFDKTISKHKYFEFKQSKNLKINERQKFKELDEVLIEIFKKLIIYLNGRTAIIPLSGGHDSRLIAYYLKQLNYSNTITYTYGRKGNEESQISEKVAKFLNLKWIFVPYKNSSMRKKYNSKKEFELMADYLGRGYSIPHLQEWEAIDYLLSKDMISRDSVVIPGHTLDFISGGHLNNLLMKGNNQFNSVIETIKSNNYNLYRTKNFEFEKDLLNYFNIKDKNRIISNVTACNYYENWNYNERQTKYIVNSIRTYDYYGLEWFLPFWDFNLINVFQSLPLEKKFQRSFFENFANYKYKELMDYAPIYQTKTNNKTKIKLPKTMLLFKVYFKDPLNFYGYFKFRDYVFKTIQYKSPSYTLFIGSDYIKLLNKRSKKR